MDKRKFRVRAGIEREKFGLEVMFQKWPAYFEAEPDSYTLNLQLGPFYCTFFFDWER